MKIEKAIERMSEYKKCHSDEYFDMAIAALEKQMPKEPNDIVDYLKFQVGNCPSCQSSVTGINHCCMYCGQALKWPD